MRGKQPPDISKSHNEIVENGLGLERQWGYPELVHGRYSSVVCLPSAAVRLHEAGKCVLIVR